MKRYIWYFFWALQAMGLFCLRGGGSAAKTTIGFIARVIAVIVLEPGFIVMQTVVERVFLNFTALSTAQQFWIGSIGAVVFNALFLLGIMFFIQTLRNPHQS
jgi:hypothetical protein